MNRVFYALSVVFALTSVTACGDAEIRKVEYCSNGGSCLTVVSRIPYSIDPVAENYVCLAPIELSVKYEQCAVYKFNEVFGEGYRVDWLNDTNVRIVTNSLELHRLNDVGMKPYKVEIVNLVNADFYRYEYSGLPIK